MGREKNGFDKRRENKEDKSDTRKVLIWFQSILFCIFFLFYFVSPFTNEFCHVLSRTPLYNNILFQSIPLHSLSFPHLKILAGIVPG